MHLLLPPSEAKNAGGRGRPLRDRPAHPLLGPARHRVTEALLTLVHGDPARATTALALPAGVAASALATDRGVLHAPTTPALRRYAGVVYDGLHYDALDAATRREADHCIYVFSGLFGVARGDEPIPDYRVPAKAVLPGLGVLSTFWRPILADVLPGMVRRGLVVDLRSSDYRVMWRPPHELTDRVVSVRVLSPLPRGGRGVVSYASKIGKGRLAAELLRRAAAGAPAGNAADVIDAWRGCGGASATTSAAGLELFDR